MHAKSQTSAILTSDRHLKHLLKTSWVTGESESRDLDLSELLWPPRPWQHLHQGLLSVGPNCRSSQRNPSPGQGTTWRLGCFFKARDPNKASFYTSSVTASHVLIWIHVMILYDLMHTPATTCLLFEQFARKSWWRLVWNMLGCLVFIQTTWT